MPAKYQPIIIPPPRSSTMPAKYQPIIIPPPRTPSPPDSFHSSSSSSTCVDTDSDSGSERPVLSLRTSPTSLCPYSTTELRSRRSSPPQIVLGAIDENSGNVQPDVPLSADKESSPITKLHAYASAPHSKKKPTIASISSPPPNEFAFLVGPNGEKFTDLRMNRKVVNAKGGGVFKRLICFG